MNVDHLRKQAKNLVKLYPELVLANPASLPLSASQAAIAKLNGFPTWEALVSKHSVSTEKSNRGQQQDPSVFDKIEVSISKFPEDTAITWDEETGRPTKVVQAYQATIDFTSASALYAFEDEDELLDEAFDDAFGNSIHREFDELKLPQRKQLLNLVEASLKRVPWGIETWARKACLLYANSDYSGAIKILEPFETFVFSAISGRKRIVLSYYALSNRPFFRAMHTLLLARDKTEQHKKADILAAKMLKICPGDNIGFRFLATKEQRMGADA